MMSLSKTKPVFIFAIILVSLFLAFLLYFILISKKPPKQTPLKTPQVSTQEPETVGKNIVKSDSKVNRDSEVEITKIHRFLPYSRDLQSSTGDALRVGIVSFKYDPPSLLRIVISGNTNLETKEPIESLKTNPAFPKQIQNFREAAQLAFSYIDAKGANHSKITVVWGSEIANKNANAWLLPSADFPEVIKVDNQYIFK